MFVFNTNSWHFKLVMYVFGDSFFTTSELDLDATIKKIEFTSAKRLDWNNKSVINDKPDKAEPDCFVYKSTPKIVNLCPYCRAVVYSITLLPFAFVAKRIPRREKKPFDIKKSRRNTKIIKVILITFFGVWATVHLLQGNYWMALFQYAVASFHWWGSHLFEYISNYMAKREAKKLKEQKQKPEEEEEDKQKNPSLFMTYLKSNHNKVCPPIAFVDKNDTEIRR